MGSSSATTTHIRFGVIGRRAVAAAAFVSFCSAPLLVQAGTGDLDPQFGNQGHVAVTGNTGPSVLELPDGRILVLGTADPRPDAQSGDVVVHRYLASGQPDTAFGMGGRVVVHLPVQRPAISAAARQPDGNVVIAGADSNGPFVARLSASGAIDESFGSAGVARPNPPGGTEPFYSSVLVLAEGDVLATISDWTSDRVDHWDATGRYLGDLMREQLAPARAARQSDGRLVVAVYNRLLKKQGVVRLESDGSVDFSFGEHGFAAIDDDYLSNLAVEPDTDRIVLCGPGLVRLTGDGHLDTTFGLQGTGYVRFGSDSVPAFDYCHRVLTTWNGDIVFIGVRAGQAVDGSDRAYVAGLTSSGLANLSIGSGTGASEIRIGAIHGARDGWFDFSSAFIRTHDGDALLTWMTDTGLQLARIELDGGNGTEVWPATPPPPPSQPPASPPPAPTPTPTVDQGSNGGGGALGWFDLVLILFGCSLRSARVSCTVTD